MIRLDLIKQAVASAPGTGNVSLGAAKTGYIGIQDHPDTTDGMAVEYIAIDGNNKEFGIGTYSATGDVLTRTWIQGKIESGVYSKNPATGVNLTANAVIQCGPVATNLNFSGCLLVHSTTESVANAVSYQLSWDTEIYDTDGFHDTVTGNSRITVPANKGIKLVRLTAGIDWAANGTSYRMARFLKNGSVFDGGAGSTLYVTSATTNAFNNIASPVLACADGDYFEVSVYQSTGGSLNVNDTTYTHFFGLEVVK